MLNCMEIVYNTDINVIFYSISKCRTYLLCLHRDYRKLCLIIKITFVVSKSGDNSDTGGLNSLVL